MADFSDFDVEIEDSRGEIPEHHNGAVAVAGTPVVITAVDSAPILQCVIQNPKKGVNVNSRNDVLYISLDGGTNYVSIARGSVGRFSGAFSSIYVKASSNGVKYELILWRRSI